MRRLRRWRGLPPEDRRLLVRALLRLALARLGLWLFPLHFVQRLLAPQPSRTPAAASRHRPQRIAWAVSAASSYVPGASCLVQATAAQALLAQSGYPASLRIGVSKDEDGRLMAHAWVEHDGDILIGGLDDLNRFRPLRARDLEISTDA